LSWKALPPSRASLFIFFLVVPVVPPYSSVHFSIYSSPPHRLISPPYFSAHLLARPDLTDAYFLFCLDFYTARLFPPPSHVIYFLNTVSDRPFPPLVEFRPCATSSLTPWSPIQFPSPLFFPPKVFLNLVQSLRASPVKFHNDFLLLLHYPDNQCPPQSPSGALVPPFFSFHSSSTAV